MRYWQKSKLEFIQWRRICVIMWITIPLVWCRCSVQNGTVIENEASKKLREGERSPYAPLSLIQPEGNGFTSFCLMVVVGAGAANSWWQYGGQELGEWTRRKEECENKRNYHERMEILVIVLMVFFTCWGAGTRLRSVHLFHCICAERERERIVQGSRTWGHFPFSHNINLQVSSPTWMIWKFTESDLPFFSLSYSATNFTKMCCIHIVYT